MQKVIMILMYDGSEFNGFQIQKGNIQTVAKRLYEVFKSIGIFEKFNASGRTDKGVHATYQVIDINIPNFWKDLDRLKRELNKKLYPSIYIREIKYVKQNFHARYSAKKRVYRYIVSTKSFNPFESKYITFINDLNQEIIKRDIKLFEGIHNFKNFKKEHGGSKNSIREIYKARFYTYKEYGIFYFEANGFLRSQVRMMVDFLLKINSGRLTNDDLIAQLKDRAITSTTLSPPNGLYLSKVIF